MELTAFYVAEGLALLDGIRDQQIETIMVLPPMVGSQIVAFGW
jgi:hypothetical protein